MSETTVPSIRPAARGPHAALTEPRPVRIALTLLAVAFLALFLLLPLAVVFVEALSKGLGPYLASYEGRQIGGRELHIRRVSSPEQLTDCQELFIPDTEEGRIAAVLRWSDKQAILTVSDSETFTRDGGAIALIRSEGRLQFEVNADALTRANLKASSQMLRLARQVTGTAR